MCPKIPNMAVMLQAHKALPHPLTGALRLTVSLSGFLPASATQTYLCLVERIYLESVTIYLFPQYLFQLSDSFWSIKKIMFPLTKFMAHSVQFFCYIYLHRPDVNPADNYCTFSLPTCMFLSEWSICISVQSLWNSTTILILASILTSTTAFHSHVIQHTSQYAWNISCFCSSVLGYSCSE